MKVSSWLVSMSAARRRQSLQRTAPLASLLRLAAAGGGLLVALGNPAVVAAREDGMIGLSGKTGGTFCRNCHGGGAVPGVAFSGPTAVAPGESATYSFTVTSNAPATLTVAGLNLAASDGTLSVTPGQGLRVELGEVTHSTPKANNGSGQAIFEVRWQAPVNPGVYTLFGAGVSANDDEKRTGDGAERTTLDIFVGVATPTPTSPPPTATATATVTPEAAACVGDCGGDDEVTVDEIITGVNIALGVAAPSACPAFDPSGDGQVTVDEILQAVNRALTGCAAP
jgi:hypothetical protein